MKSLILNIETSTKNCSVCLSENGKILAAKEINDGGYSHAENLHPFIENIMNEIQCNFSDISAIAISKGPGSFTGLRIGVSAAKGLCFALDIPLISIDTLEAFAHSLTVEKGVIIPMLDARRMEVYQAVYTADYEMIEATKAVISNEHSYQKYLAKDKVFFIGDAVSKCSDIIKHPNAVYKNDTFPSAKYMAQLSHIKFLKNEFEDVAYFEPFYLKDFVGVKINPK